MQLLQEKVIRIIHIKEALNIKVHITEMGGGFLVQLLVKKVFFNSEFNQGTLEKVMCF